MQIEGYLGKYTMMTQPIQVDLGLISSKQIFDLVKLISSQSSLVSNESNLNS